MRANVMDKLETFWIRHILPFCEKHNAENTRQTEMISSSTFRENADDDTSNTYDSKFSEREEADDDEGVAREQRE